MSSVKKIAKSTKTKAARAKSEAGKSTVTRGRIAKRGAEFRPEEGTHNGHAERLGSV